MLGASIGQRWTYDIAKTLYLQGFFDIVGLTWKLDGGGGGN